MPSKLPLRERRLRPANLTAVKVQHCLSCWRRQGETLIGWDNPPGRARACKDGGAVKATISCGAATLFFLFSFFSESFQSVTFILGSCTSGFPHPGSDAAHVSPLLRWRRAHVLLFATFYPRPPCAHFLPAGPKNRGARYFCVAAVGCESLQFLLRGRRQWRLLCDASFQMFLVFWPPPPHPLLSCDLFPRDESSFASC